jgi:C-5 cytosine-specific DNA methylase
VVSEVSDVIRCPSSTLAASDGFAPQAKPLAVDLCSGLGGWAEGLEEEGYDVIRVDIEDMFAATGTPKPEPCLLMLQDICTIHGSQFKGVDLIVASPPCQAYSYMAMPWKLAKAKAAAIRADETGAALERLNRLFNACFRIQREACHAGGRHIPMVVENVRGAQPWVGPAAWNYGSYYLWGDVPALMPIAARAIKNGSGGSWFGLNPDGSPGALNNARDGLKVPGFRFDGSGRSFQTASVDGMKTNGAIPHIRDGHPHTKHLTNPAEHIAEGRKGAGAGAEWFDQNLCSLSSKSSARKAASARIAKIPLTLSRHIAAVYRPRPDALLTEQSQGRRVTSEKAAA